jgi:uncharacterized protein (PEP-CTERM system associated)
MATTDTVMARAKFRTAVLVAAINGACLQLEAQAQPSGQPQPAGQLQPATPDSLISPTVDNTLAADLEKRKKTGSLLPGVRSSLEYSTNYNLDARSVTSKNADFIGVIVPYLRAESESPRLRYKLDLGLNNVYRIRTKESILGRVNLQSKLTAAVAGDYLWVDATGIVANTNRDLFGKLDVDPNLAFTNTAQVRQVSVSPYLKSRLGGFADTTVRYGVQYNDNTATAFEQSKFIQTVSGDIRGVETNGRNWNWSVSGEFSRRKFGDNNVDRRFSIASLYWVPITALRLTGSGVFDQIAGVTSRDGKTKGFGPGIGIDLSLDEQTRAEAKLIKRYYGTSQNFNFSHYSKFMLASLSYNKGVAGSVDSGIFSIDPGSVYGNYAVVNNPIYRTFLAESLRVGYGVPYGAGLIKDTFILERKLGGSFGLIGLRNTLTLNAYRNRRDTTIFAVTTPGLLTGPRAGTLPSLSGTYEGLITLTEFSLDYRYRFDSRTALLVSYSNLKNQADSAKLASQTSSIKTGVSTKLTPDIEVGGGMRYSKSRISGDAPSDSDDKAIFGSIDFRF